MSSKKTRKRYKRLLYGYQQHEEQALDQSRRHRARRNDGHHVQHSGNFIFSLKQNLPRSAAQAAPPEDFWRFSWT